MEALKNFNDVRGFELIPEGKRLGQIVDFSTPIGIVYERSIGYIKAPHFHDRLTISFARGASRSLMKMRGEDHWSQLDEHWGHWMPARLEHEQKHASTIYDTFALFPDSDWEIKVMSSLQLDPRAIKDLQKAHTFPRSVLLNELVDRYFFHRILKNQTSSKDLSVLENQILSEVFYLLIKKVLGRCPGPLSAKLRPEMVERANTAPNLERAIEYIEAHLFDKMTSTDLAKQSHMGQATLFRLFKKELSMTPFEYVRNRRLDEAKKLIHLGQYQIGDVCLLVGYEDLSAFSKAFKQKFDFPPSHFLPQ